MERERRSDDPRLAVIEQVVLRLEARLFGDGQPGEIAGIKHRIRALENWRWKIIGGAGAFALLFELGTKLHEAFK